MPRNNFAYNRTEDTGVITGIDEFGNYNVNVGGRPADYEGLSSDGTHQFMVGDTVIVSTTGGDRGSPFVKGYCPYGG